MATFGYVRISTENQEAENQRHRINEYAARQGIKIDELISETVSSRKKDRGIYKVLERLKSGDQIIVTELSRLGRSSVSEIFNIIETIKLKKAGLCVIRDNIEIAGGEMTVQAETLVFALGIAARLERELISERTKTALKARKEQGVKLGRPEGYSVLTGREDELQKYLDMGLNKTSIAKLMGVSRGALYNYLNRKTSEAKPKKKPNAEKAPKPAKRKTKKMSDTERFLSVAREIGKRFIRIYLIRERLKWSRKRFDKTLLELAKEGKIQLNPGDPSDMTKQQKEDSYKDSDGRLRITINLVDGETV